MGAVGGDDRTATDAEELDLTEVTLFAPLTETSCSGTRGAPH